MIAYCIATRGRPDLLAETVREILGNVADEDAVRVVIAFDEDDNDTRRAVLGLIEDRRIVGHEASREDALGAKYNRAYRIANEVWQEPGPDLFVVGCDDAAVTTPGWDRVLNEAAAEFPDGIGALYFGNNIPNVFQPGIALTRGFVEAVGHFMQPHTPFWWHDTWADEIAQMIGRVVRLPVDMAVRGRVDETRGARDIAFWARFFDEMRPERVETARKIIAGLNEHPYRKRQLLSMLPVLEQHFLARNANLRDAERAQALEQAIAIEAGPDARTVRLKEAATLLMAKAA